VGFPVCDTIGGLTAALHITAALAGRESTGRGVFLDVSMLEAAIASMGWTVSNYLVSGIAPAPMGDQNATAAPSGTFLAADGPLNIAANRQEQFETLCGLVDRPDLLTDGRFAEREARKQHRQELNHELNMALSRKSAGEWEQLLNAAGVPAARIVTVPQALELEQLAHRGFFTELPFPDGTERVLRLSGSGVLHDGEPLRASDPPPLLGEHTHEPLWKAAS
jgi:crotonobetainyl-CoA:carnitine CoA-transferase CaiB-like acyl-CoA transferase